MNNRDDVKEHDRYLRRRSDMLEKILCSCGQSVSRINIKKHLLSTKHKNITNMVITEIKIIDRTIVHFCPCGGQFTNSHKSKHNATLLHRNYKIYDIQVKKEQQELLESKIDNFADKYYNTVKYQKEQQENNDIDEYDDFKYYRQQ